MRVRCSIASAMTALDTRTKTCSVLGWRGRSGTAYSRPGWAADWGAETGPRSLGGRRSIAHAPGSHGGSQPPDISGVPSSTRTSASCTPLPRPARSPCSAAAPDPPPPGTTRASRATSTPPPLGPKRHVSAPEWQPQIFRPAAPGHGRTWAVGRGLGDPPERATRAGRCASARRRQRRLTATSRAPCRGAARGRPSPAPRSPRPPTRAPRAPPPRLFASASRAPVRPTLLTFWCQNVVLGLNPADAIGTGASSARAGGGGGGGAPTNPLLGGGGGGKLRLSVRGEGRGVSD